MIVKCISTKLTPPATQAVQMDAVDHFAKRKQAIRALEDEAAVLREPFPRPGARLRSNQFEVAVRHQSRRVFQKDHLPPQILNDRKYRADTTTTVVSVRPLAGCRPAQVSKADPVLIEPLLRKHCSSEG